MTESVPTPATLAEWFSVYAPPELREPLMAACATRGKRRGRVLASIPSEKSRRVVGAWRSLMSTLAPSRAGLFAMISADPEERSTFEAVEKWMSENPGIRDLVRLAGGSPLEFSLFHCNQNPESIVRFADIVDIDADACGLAWYAGGDR